MRTLTSLFAILIALGAQTASVAVADTPTPTATSTPSPTSTGTETPTPTATATLTPPPNYAYINHENDDIAVIDTSNDMVVDFLPSDPGTGMTAGPGGKRMYASSFEFGTVSYIDTSNQTVTDTFEVGDDPGAIAVDPSGSRMYVHLRTDGTIAVVDTGTGSSVASIPIGAFGAGIGLAMHPAGAKLYVNVPASDQVDVIATASNMILSTIPVGSAPAGVAVNPSGTRVYISNQADGTVSVIDTVTDAVIDTITTGGTPYNMVVHPDGTRLYVGNLTGNSVFVIDTTTASVITSIGVGALPTGLSILPNGVKLYVTNRGDDNVSVIQTSTNTELHRIPVGDAPSAIGQFINAGPNTSLSTVVATGTLDFSFPDFNASSLTFDSISYDVFGVPVNVSIALGGNPMPSPINVGPYLHGGFDITLSAATISPPFSLSGPGRLALLNNISINVPNLTVAGTVLPNGPFYSLSATLGGGGPGLTGPFVITANSAANTPQGSGVVVPVTANVNLCPGSLGLQTPISVEFASVDSPGTTLVTGTCQTPGSVPPNIRLDVGGLHFFFDVSTTADFTPPITICTGYPDANGDGKVDGTGINELSLVVLHDEGGGGNFQPVPGQTIDPVNNRICCDVTSLSPFLLASEGVPKGFIPFENSVRACEKKLSKLSSNLLKAIVKCNRKAADALLKAKTFDSVACETEARDKFNDTVADLNGCPACALANAGAIRDATENTAEGLSSELYCAGSSQLGGDDLGFVPANTTAATCAKRHGKAAAKLGKKLGQCHGKHIDALFQGHVFDVDQCTADEAAAFESSVSFIFNGCPACMLDNVPLTRNRIERFSNEILSQIYCEGTTAVP